MKLLNFKNVYLKVANILTILFIVFISLFAFDSFSEPNSWIQNLVGLLIHLIPSLVLIGILIWANRKPLWGGIAFLVMSICFTIFFKTYEMWQGLVFLTLPILAVGILFILGRKK